MGAEHDQKFVFIVNDQNVVRRRDVTIGGLDGDTMRVVNRGLTPDQTPDRSRRSDGRCCGPRPRPALCPWNGGSSRRPAVVARRADHRHGETAEKLRPTRYSTQYSVLYVAIAARFFSGLTGPAERLVAFSGMSAHIPRLRRWTGFATPMAGEMQGLNARRYSREGFARSTLR